VHVIGQIPFESSIHVARADSEGSSIGQIDLAELTAVEAGSEDNAHRPQGIEVFSARVNTAFAT
jgi:hypothetical protein